MATMAHTRSRNWALYLGLTFAVLLSAGPLLFMAIMASRKKWSKHVTEHSDALDLEDRVFAKSPVEMARSLKRSADRSTRRKSSPFRSAMSMLVFYENRAGAKLSPARKRALERAKAELRKLYRNKS